MAKGVDATTSSRIPSIDAPAICDDIADEAMAEDAIMDEASIAEDVSMAA